MGRTLFPALDVVTARSLAISLEDLANRLGRAVSADEFVGALEDNGHVWEKVRHAAGRYGWILPRRLIDFELGSAARARHRLSDHDVEAIIAINRQISSAIMSGSVRNIPIE